MNRREQGKVGVSCVPFILDDRLYSTVNMWAHQPESHRRKATLDIYFFPRLSSVVLALMFYREKDGDLAYGSPARGRVRFEY